jgi:predicted amidophosphoribosyltransferase
MECTKCKTWNPDDKTFCWRCQAELPKRVAPKKKREGFPQWAWLGLVLLFAVTVLVQCVFMPMPGQ